MPDRAALSVPGVTRSPRPRKVPTPTRAKLLEAAAYVFADRGYYHATIPRFAAAPVRTWRR